MAKSLGKDLLDRVGRLVHFPLLMRWTAPTIGIAMSQYAVTIYELLSQRAKGTGVVIA